MQGRQDPGKESREWFARQELASVNGTGKHRPIPQRPPGMARIDAPPPTTRVARPARGPQQPRRWRRQLLILGGAFILCGVLAWIIGYAAVNLINAGNTSAGAVATATDFLSAIASSQYDRAYSDLGANITVQMTHDEFVQQAQNDDRCYGTVTSYTEVPGSATIQNNTQSYAYTITRKKLSQSYQLHLTLQQDSNGNWTVTSYGSDLGPGQAPCA